MKKLKWYLKQGATLKCISITQLMLLTSSNRALTIVEHTTTNEVVKVVEFIS